jgi:hypothetical protein
LPQEHRSDAYDVERACAPDAYDAERACAELSRSPEHVALANTLHDEAVLDLDGVEEAGLEAALGGWRSVETAFRRATDGPAR